MKADIEVKTGISDAECERLDKLITNGNFEVGPNLLKQGIMPGEVRNTLLLKNVDRDVIEYLRSQATAAHKSQTDIINGPSWNSSSSGTWREKKG